MGPATAPALDARGAGALQQRVLDRVERGAMDLPVLPPVAQEILALGAGDADAARLTVLVQRDAGLAASVLRVANSPMYAARSPIVSLQHAVSRLGMVALREMAFAAAVRSKVFAAAGFESVTRELWSHALAAGAYAKEIARLRKKNAETAFLAGLLHDIGMPVLLHAIGQAAGPALVPADIALAFANEHHTLVGARLARAWKLPEVVAVAAEHHHAMDPGPAAAEIAATAALADRLAHASFGADDTPVHEPRLAALLNLYPDEVEALLARRAAVSELVESSL